MTLIATVANVDIERRNRYVALSHGGVNWNFEPREIPDLVAALECAAKPEPIVPVDVRDGAVFYTGKSWRKLVELKDGRFALLDEQAQATLNPTTADYMLSALRAFYTKEPT